MALLDMLAPLLLNAIILSTLAEVLSNTLNQEAEGSSDFKYFNKEALDVANQVQQLLLDVDVSMTEYIADLKTSSNVAKVVKKYKDIVEYLKGSKCEETEVKDLISAHKIIDKTVDTCAATASEGDKEDLKKVIKEALIKLQKADNILRKISEDSVLQEKDLSADCLEEERRKALDDIDSILSNESKAKIDCYFRNAIFTPQEQIEICVDKETKCLKETFENLIEKLEMCKFKNKL